MEKRFSNTVDKIDIKNTSDAAEAKFQNRLQDQRTNVNVKYQPQTSYV